MYKYVFGPVPSRRLGVSLGVDLVEDKTCNMNCIYCECGPNIKTYDNTRRSYVDIELVKQELKEALKTIKPDFITFSGNGEPTLNKDIGKLIRWIKENTNSKIAIITNSTLLNDDSVIEDLLGADILLPSLDAMKEETFLKLNRPNPNLKVEDILEGLNKIVENHTGKVYLEIFITAGLNDTNEELEMFAKYLKNLDIDGIQLNTLARPGAVEWIKPATFERLEEIKKYFENYNIKSVEVIKKYQKRSEISSYSKRNEILLINMLDKRPYQVEELECVLGKEVHKYLEILGEEGKLKSLYKDGVFYVEKQ